MKKPKRIEWNRRVYGKHTTLYLRFERMKRRRGKHTTCIELVFLELSNFDCLSVVGNGQRLRFLLRLFR